jgi:chromosome segregation ATPase
MAVTVPSPHGVVAQRASAELDQLNADIHDGETFLAQMAERLATLGQEQRERRDALQVAFQARETARGRCQQARTLANLAQDTDASDQTAADLLDLELALEAAESHYRAIAEECDQQDALASAECAKLEVATREGQAMLAGLQQERVELQSVLAEAHRRAGTELLQRFTAQAQALTQARADAQQVVDEQTAALAALADAAKGELAAWPGLLLAFQQAYVPVEDGTSRRLELALALRNEMRAWLTEHPSNWALNLPHRFFLLSPAELNPRIMGMTISEIQAALEQHKRTVRSQVR